MHPGDVVAAHDRMALVAEVTGSTIRLATPIPGLAEDDNLQVATVRGVTDISFQSSGKVTVTKEVRRTDFLADVTGWRMAGAGPGATAFVLKSSDTSISLTSMLDGVLPADKIGLADVATGFFLLRLKEKPDVVAGDGVQLSGLDRLRQRAIVALWQRCQCAVPRDQHAPTTRNDAPVRQLQQVEIWEEVGCLVNERS